MADFDRNRPRYDEQNRGAFGYEGEGYMRGGGRDVEDRWRGGYGDIRWNEEQRYRGAGYGSEPGYRGAGYLGGSYGETEPRGYSNLNRGDYVTEIRPRPTFRGRGPKNFRRSDERIGEDVCERLLQDDRVDASDIEVNVKEAVVILTGSVDDRPSKRRAEDIVESVSGVRDVQNQIWVSRQRGEATSEKKTLTGGNRKAKRT
jgi:osmotically-inducible protein OsmY